MSDASIKETNLTFIKVISILMFTATSLISFSVRPESGYYGEDEE